MPISATSDLFFIIHAHERVKFVELSIGTDRRQGADGGKQRGEGGTVAKATAGYANAPFTL